MQLSCASAFFSTNFADNHHSLHSKQNHHELDLISTEKLSKAMLKYYEGWIANAPGEYKKTLCGTAYPVAMTYKHGQNRVIQGNGTTIDAQRQYWTHSVDIKHILTYKVAFAFHLQYVSHFPIYSLLYR